MRQTFRRTTQVVGVIVLWVVCPMVCKGIVLHPEGEPDPGWMDKPNNAVVGRWSSNASCVAISPNYIITTRHQGGGVGTTVYFDGIAYTVQQVWLASGTEGQYDLRVCRIEAAGGGAANLSYYTPPYPLSNELNQQIVIGGCGCGRGDNLVSEGHDRVYGYSWDYSSSNPDQRWCTNLLEDEGEGTLGLPRYYFFVVAFFDGLDQPLATIYEGIPADHDSGGGWFIRSGRQWYVAALSFGVEHGSLAQSWFRNSTWPNPPDPDYMLGVRISEHAGWIRSVVDEVDCHWLIGDINENSHVDVGDFAALTGSWQDEDCSWSNSYCEGTDLWADGMVDLEDFEILVSVWLDAIE